MNDPVKEILSRLNYGETAVLCLVLSASGSVPRGAGAQMAVFSDGTASGTIGGGSAELLAAREAARLLCSTESSLVKTYGLHPGGENDPGMICGGEITVLFWKISGAQLPLFERLDAQCSEDSLVLMLQSEQLLDAAIYSRESGLLFAKSIKEAQIRPFLCDSPMFFPGEPSFYLEPIAQKRTVCIFGGGHVGRALVPVLKPLQFRVVVLDDRPSLAIPERYPEADEVRLCDFQRIRETIALTKNDYCVVMTPGHLSDRAILSQVLRTEAPYVGCIGSRKKIAQTHAFLLADGLTQSDCDRVHSPIGLAIGAITPEEIAISVAAELIAFRAGLIS